MPHRSRRRAAVTPALPSVVASGLASGLASAAAAATVVTGVAAAAPASAEASAPPVWQRVAACESSGRWHVNTHNHFYGGLQFWQPTWVDFGGRRYAPRADLATPRQQIEVARRVLAVQGPKAWPVCGKRARLTRRNGHATAAALPPLGPVIRSLPHPNPHARPAPQPPARHEAPRVDRYRVRAGESLSVIAERFGVRGGWQALWAYNRTNVPNPNVVFVGQILQIP